MMTATESLKRFALAHRKKFQTRKRFSVDDLQKKCNSAEVVDVPNTLNNSKKLKKSKVKQMAAKINSKIVQIIKHVGKYSEMLRKTSSKPQSKAAPTKPISVPIYRYTRERTPIPSSCIKSKVKVPQKTSCFIAEDGFNQMTVKEKAQLYNKFIEDHKTKPKVKTTAIISPPVPPPRKKRSINSKSLNNVASAEHSEYQESALKTKKSIDETQSDFQMQANGIAEQNFDLEKPVKPLRQKKIRRNNAWKPSSSFTTKDSETMKKGETEIFKAPHESSFVELDENLLRVVNSPRKIKSAYILTVNDTSHYLNLETSCTLETSSNHNHEVRSLGDSFTDQGFETESNGTESPTRTPEKKILKHHSKSQTPENTFGFSTPIKDRLQHSFPGRNSAKQQLFSPINKPMNKRQRSLYDKQPYRNSMLMPVLREDQPLAPQKETSSRNFNYTEQVFFANAPTLEMTTDLSHMNKNRSSKFWIKCDDFSIAFDIQYIEGERLHLLYEIFSQTSCSAKDLHFGIDNHKFSVHHPNEPENISASIPTGRGNSHYWFSTGDLAIPFSGKYLTSLKIQQLFECIKASVEETGVLSFGVDDMAFSNVPEFWSQPPKLSMESNYSMLVGLHSGNSNGLEGRTKYAWPHSNSASDLDQAVNIDDDLAETETGSLSSLTLEELTILQNSEVMLNLESYCFNYEKEPLDQLFERKSN